MTTEATPQRMLFTFRRNGDSNGTRLIEITAEPLEQHEAPAGADRQSWFGAENDVATLMQDLSFAPGDVEGVVSALHTNRVATREAEILHSALSDAGFSATS